MDNDEENFDWLTQRFTDGVLIVMVVIIIGVVLAYL